MLLGVIPMFCFEILSDFGENLKRGKLEKFGHFGFYAAAWDASSRRG